MATENSIETKKVAGALANMSIDELIFNMAKGIADGQARLDQTCMDLAVQMGDAQIEFGKIAGTNEPDLISLVELGFTPNFYQFVETVLELRVSVTSQYEEEQEVVKSEVDSQSEERQAQTQYASDRRNNYSGYSFGRGGSWRWGWGGGGWGYGGHGHGYSGGSSSSSRENTAQKSKAVKVNTVDATFASKYGYEVAASSLIKTKIVPIPPPQVLEEAVQNAAKERKEWAKRFALLRFSKNLLPAISDEAESMANTIENYLERDTDTKAVTGIASVPAYADANNLKIAADVLGEEYDKLTNEHWAVIENVKDRRQLDDQFEALLKSTANLMAAYKADHQGVYARDEGVTDDEFKDILTNCSTKLVAMKDKITGIMDRLPLTPEEMAKQEQAAEDESTENNS